MIRASIDGLTSRALALALTLGSDTAAAQVMPRADHPMMWGGMGWLGTILWILIAAGVVLVLLALAKRLGGDAPRPHREPLDILKERLAAGEIDIEEYEARKQAHER